MCFPEDLLIDCSCGSAPGNSPVHLAAARALANAFHKHGVTLIYGGGTVGLMGELARTLVSLSGPSSVHGIIPAPLIALEQSGTAKSPISEALYGRTTIVPDMHTRKQLMARHVIEGGEGSGFVALSGGYGTIEELFEVITWNQLGIHKKGVVVFNVDGYYDGLLQWIRNAVNAGFIVKSNVGIVVEATEAEEVLKELSNYRVADGRFSLDWTQN